MINDWLLGRLGKVVVQGTCSDSFDFKNMTFQGTVWGPPLWNLFFGDSPLAMRRCAFQEVIYADDLNAFRRFSSEKYNDLDLLDAMPKLITS